MIQITLELWYKTLITLLINYVFSSKIPTHIHHVGYVNQPYFWNQPFTGALANRKSAYFGKGSCNFCFLSFLYVFNYMFLKERCKQKICFTVVKFNFFNPFCSQCTLSLPPENIRKLKCFLVFLGVIEECNRSC